MSALEILARPLRTGIRTLQRASLGRVPRWRTIGGQFSMHIDPSDWADRAFYFGYYEEQLVRLITEKVRPGDVCIDVGAQKGFITLHMARAVGRGGRVFSFEPDPRAMQTLRSNVERNGFGHVTLCSEALGEGDGTCSFSLSNQIGWSSIFPSEIAKPEVETVISVRTRRLDHILEEAGITPSTHRLSFIKIDAEGAEPIVLRGALQTLRRFRPTIHIEINKPSLSAGGFSPNVIEDLLRDLDYRFYAIRSRRGAGLFSQLSLTLVVSLASEIGNCEDVLAVAAGPVNG